MKKLTHVLAVLVFGFASAMSASASQEAAARSPNPNATAHMVKTSYVPPVFEQSSQAPLVTSVNEAAKSVADETQLTNELPQNGVLMLLAGLAVIVVIGKRRMSR